MLHSSPAYWLAVLPAITALSAFAQTAPAPSDSQPAAPPVLSFRSAFDGYQRYVEEKAIPWKEANETVHQRGGWQAYAKESAEKAPGEAEPSKTGPDAHAGHPASAPAKKEQP